RAHEQPQPRRTVARRGGAHPHRSIFFLRFWLKPQGHFFATIAGYCRFSHDNHFQVPWLGPLSSPRPWRPADAAEGGPSVMLRFDLPDGRVVRAEIAARLYVMTGRMIGARYPIED